MKLTEEHYQHIKEEISKLDQRHIKEHAKKVLESKKFKNFEARMVWDIAHAVNLGQFFCREIYSYAHDEHIETALKKACSELGLSFKQ